MEPELNQGISSGDQTAGIEISGDRGVGSGRSISLTEIAGGMRHALPLELSDKSIEVPEFAFRPELWTGVFLSGLDKLIEAGEFNEKRVLEAGVGTGMVSAYLLNRVPEILAIYGSDYDGRLTKLAEKNIRDLLGEGGSRFIPIHGDRDLVSWFKPSGEMPAPDFIVACVPQVPCPDGKRIDHGDNLAHYYAAERYPSNYGRYGLALVDNLITQAGSVLSPEGKIVLNLAGRPGEKVLHKLFSEAGYKSRVLYFDFIQQDMTTELTRYVCAEQELKKEDGNYEFEFYVKRPDGTFQHIGARLAEAFRRGGTPVFHRLSVFELSKKH